MQRCSLLRLELKRSLLRFDRKRFRTACRPAMALGSQPFPATANQERRSATQLAASWRKRRSLLRLRKSEVRFAASPSEGSLLHFGTSPGQNAPRAGAIPPRRDAACCVSGMRFAASPAGSQIRWRSSASQPTRMARAKVSRSECHVCNGVTGRPGPVSSRPSAAQAAGWMR